MRSHLFWCTIILLWTFTAKTQTGYYGAIDTNGQTVIPFIYDHISSPSHGLMVVKKDRYFGVINTQGKMIVPFSPASISSYDHGMATYYMESVGCGYLDTLGELVIPAVYDRCQPFYDSLTWVAKTIDGENRYALINRRGEELTPFTYDQVGQHVSEDGLLKVREGGLYGLINHQGHIIVEPQYQSIGHFSEGKLQVRKNGVYGFIDRSGQEVIPCQYPWAGYFNNGQSYTRNGATIIFINHAGESVYDATGLSLTSIFDKNGLARVERDGKIGYMNREQEMIVPLTYRVIAPLSNGRRRVVIGNLNGVVNENWELIIPVEYEDIGADSDGLIVAGNNDLYGAIDSLNKVIIPFKFDYIEGFRQGRNFTLAKQDSGFGVINRKGEVLIPFAYKRVPQLAFPFGLCPFERDGKMGFLNLQGEAKIPFIYQRARPFNKHGISICQQ